MRKSALLAFLLLSGGAVAASPATTETAVFAGGCFWSMEAVFDDVPGVTSAIAGYTGGTVANPSYAQVSAGDTGHVEAVQVTYDPSKISYEELLNLFWRNVDPMDATGQFCDHGPEYRAQIFTLDDGQVKKAAASQEVTDRQLGQKTVVKITPAAAFYAAEEYHQQYKRKNPLGYGAYREGCGRDRKLKAIWEGKQ